MRTSGLKRSLFLPLIAALLTVGPGCGPRGPQSIIRMSDLHTQKQLISGFFSLEAGAWRWTGKTFTVSLKVPAEAAAKGAVLTLQGTVASESLTNAPLEIASSIGGTALAPLSATKPGEVIYRADVPAAVLQRPVIVANFSVSSTHRVPGDLRDLGMIASVISLRAK